MRVLASQSSRWTSDDHLAATQHILSPIADHLSSTPIQPPPDRKAHGSIMPRTRQRAACAEAWKQRLSDLVYCIPDSRRAQLEHVENYSIGDRYVVYLPTSTGSSSYYIGIGGLLPREPSSSDPYCHTAASPYVRHATGDATSERRQIMAQPILDFQR